MRSNLASPLVRKPLAIGRALAWARCVGTIFGRPWRDWVCPSVLVDRHPCFVRVVRLLFGLPARRLATQSWGHNASSCLRKTGGRGAACSAPPALRLAARLGWQRSWWGRAQQRAAASTFLAQFRNQTRSSRPSEVGGPKELRTPTARPRPAAFVSAASHVAVVALVTIWYSSHWWRGRPRALPALRHYVLTSQSSATRQRHQQPRPTSRFKWKTLTQNHGLPDEDYVSRNDRLMAHREVNAGCLIEHHPVPRPGRTHFVRPWVPHH